MSSKLIAGDPVAMEEAWQVKSRKMIEEHRMQIDLTAHKKKMKLVISDLKALFGFVDPWEGEEMDELQNITVTLEGGIVSFRSNDF